MRTSRGMTMYFAGAHTSHLRSLKEKMSTPLFDKPQFQPLKVKLKREGWWPLLLLLGFWRGMYGIPEALKVLLRIEEENIDSGQLAYSPEYMSTVSSGMWSLLSLVILLFVIYNWTAEVRQEAIRIKNTEQTNESEPDVVDNA